MRPLKLVDILEITEAKFEELPASQFLFDGFSEPFRLDRNKTGGSLIIFVREDLPSKLLQKYVFPVDIEGLFIELNFRKCK